MIKINYLDFVNFFENKYTISLIDKIDVNLLNSNLFESLYYSLPLIEKMILEIHKLIPESDIENYDQGIMKTPNSIIDSNIKILPESLINIIKEIYGENGIRNQIFHIKEDTISITVSYEQINYLIANLLIILKNRIDKYNGFTVKNVEYI